ncbi:chemotaxis protein CheX [Gorillibacterium sp. sgz500922]|uniref:chemotaxis protein CheX n=1 Tax=Gorillibacterium sp. sgz500922 TaxID=3446694 RepID=UPI003F67429E
MQAAYINPFLMSSCTVIESLIQVKPTLGELTIKQIEIGDDRVWLKIGIVGGMTGEVVFGFPEAVALRIASAMMGGFSLTEFDEISRSAISELANMISGNASTLLYNQGICVDITPPAFMEQRSGVPGGVKALSIPLNLHSYGAFDIYVITR